MIALRVTTFTYDVLGRLTTSKDPLDRYVDTTYDNLGRVTAVTLPHAGSGPGAYPSYTYTYDADGNLLTEKDPADVVASTYVYDKLHRNTTVTDAEAGVTTYEYDAAGNLTKLTDSVSNATTYVYDVLNRPTSETNALGKTQSYVYDAVSNLSSQTDRNGRKIEYDYDNLQRLSEERWKDGGTTVETITFDYDAASQITSASDSVSEYAYTYDDLGNVLTVDNFGTSGVPNVLLSNVYDNLSRRTSAAAEVAGTDDYLNSYQYDALSRTTEITQTDGSPSLGDPVSDKRIDITYTSLSRFDTITRYKDLTATTEVATSTYAYDNQGRLTDLTHKTGSTTHADYDWSFDVLNRITQFVSPDGTSNYSYDDISQLTAATHSYQTNESYSYDANGNRTNTGYTTGTNNRLTSDGTYNYTYDDEGNRTKKTEIATGDYVDYTWDHRNRLTNVEFRDSLDALTKQVEYDYDLYDRRIAKRVDDDGNGTFDSEWNFVYDADEIVLVYDDSSSLTNRYLHGPAVDQIFADEDALGDVLWSLPDNQGTVRDQLDTDGVKVNHLKYDAFGNITAQSDPSVDFLYAYTGREWDPDAELYFYRARWYDPMVGRFLSEDPLSFAAGDTNLSRYVANNTPNLIDPSGLEGEDYLPSFWGGFGQSLADSYESMTISLGAGMTDLVNVLPGVDVDNDYMYEQSYELGPLGQTSGVPDYRVGIGLC